jgi:hypothetical protein
MPQVKLYKNGDTLIPVEGTKVCNGYQCPWTGDLFVTKRSYVKHLKLLRAARMHAKARRIRQEKELSGLWKLTTIEEIAEWIEKNSALIFDRCKFALYSNMYSKKNALELREEFRVKLTYLKVQHSPQVSNTHSSPVGKPRNFSREPGMPVGYPGWSGRVEFEIYPRCGISGSDVGRLLRMNTGTGGGSGDFRYYYDLKLFEDDWPGLCEHVVMSKLTDEPVANFLFGHPKVFKS